MKSIPNALVSSLLLFVPATLHATSHLAAEVKVAQVSGALTDGEIRKVDIDARKITIRHGPIQNLEMPAMTMVFQVKDPAMLDKVKAGDKVRFKAEKIGGAFIVTQIESDQ